MKPTTILIADTSATLNQHLKTLVGNLGLQVIMASDGEECLRLIELQKPKLALIDLFIPKQNALEILRQLKNQNTPVEEATKILILSNQALIQNIKECMKWGASDYLLKPIEPEDIVSRIIFHLQPTRAETKTENQDSSSQLYLHLVELIFQQLKTGTNLFETLTKLTQMTAMAFKSVRASIIQKQPQRIGTVIASSDSASGTEWTIDLRKYPEVLYSLNTGKTVVIENIDNDPTLNQIKNFLTNIQFNSMVVIPLYHGADEEAFGVLSVRLPPNRQKISNEEIQFAHLVGHAVSLAFRLNPPSPSEV